MQQGLMETHIFHFHRGVLQIEATVLRNQGKSIRRECIDNDSPLSAARPAGKWNSNRHTDILC